MKILNNKYLHILKFLQDYPRTYSMAEICDHLGYTAYYINYLLKIKYIRGWYDDTFSLDAEGENYLAYYKSSLIEKITENKKWLITTGISILAIIISLIALLTP